MTRRRRFAAPIIGRTTMKNPLDSLWGTVICGLILTLILHNDHRARARRLTWTGYLHSPAGSTLMAGVMWIGLLYYFNFVNVAAAKAAAADSTGAGISKHVMPRALFWFRWAAVVTWLAGARAAVAALPRRLPVPQQGVLPDRRRSLAGHVHAVQRLGADLAQPEEDPGHRAGDGRGEEQGAPGGVLASRSNTMLSIPMLYFMAAGARTARCSSASRRTRSRRRTAEPSALAPQCGAGAFDSAVERRARHDPLSRRTSRRSSPARIWPAQPQQWNVSVCGCISAMADDLALRVHEGDRQGISVFFIHMHCASACGNTNSMPSFGPRYLRNISPWARFRRCSRLRRGSGGCRR